MSTYKNKLNSINYYLFIFLFITVSLIPFNTLDIKIANLPFHYIYIGTVVSILVILSLIQYPRLTVFDKWLIFLMLGFLLSLITSIDRLHTVRVLGGFFLKGVFVAFVAEKILKYRVKDTNTFLIICASLVSIIGLIELFFEWNPYPRAKGWPFFIIKSTIGNPLPFAVYLVSLFPLALLYLKEKKSFIRILPFLLIISGIFISFSRSSWVALLIVNFIYYFEKQYPENIFKNLLYTTGFISVFILLIFLMPPEIKSYFKYAKANIRFADSISFKHRKGSYIASAKIIKEYPLFGIGFGNYPKVYDKYKVEYMRSKANTPDNMYLRFFCEAGIIGAGIFFVFIIHWMHKLWKSRDNPVVWAIFCGLMGFLINQLAADLFFWAAPQFAFWMLLGWGVGLIGNTGNNGTGNQNG